MKTRRTAFPKYTHNYRDRHGKVRSDFRRGAVNIPLPYPLLGPEYWESYREALADYIASRAPGARSQIGSERTKPGSCAAAFVAYTGSAAFRMGLAPSTQRGHLSILRRWRDEYGEHRLAHLQRRHVALWVAEKAETPGAALGFLRALRRMMQYCISIDLIEIDPTLGVKPPRQRSTGIHCWTESEIEQYRQYHPVGFMARTAMELLLGTGQRRSDVVRLGWQHLHNGTIHVVQQKTGWSGDIPIPPGLAQVLDALPKDNLTFLVTGSGAPYAAGSFGNSFHRWCSDAGLSKECSAHGLRKAACRRLAEAGCTTHEIASISGHRTLAEVARYTRAADQASLAVRARRKTGTEIGEPVIRFAKSAS